MTRSCHEFDTNFQGRGGPLMTEHLCISSYASILAIALSDNTDDAVYRLILEWAIEDYNLTDPDGQKLDLPSTKISRLVNRVREVDAGFCRFFQNPKYRRDIVEYFEDAVVPLLTTNKNKMFYKFFELIENDDEICPDDKNELLKYYGTGPEDRKEGEFLAYLLILAVGSKNKKDAPPKVSTSTRDLIFLREVDSTCPITRKPLVSYNKEGALVESYEIIKIYPSFDGILIRQDEIPDKERPDDLNAPSNLIAVDKKVAASYKADPDLATYLKLKNAKAYALERAKKTEIKKLLTDKIRLNEQLKAVVSRLASLQTDSVVTKKLRMEPLELDKKILPENVSLKKEIRDAVVDHMSEIQKLFAQCQLEKVINTSTITNDMAVAYDAVKGKGYSQNMVFDELADWILDSLQLGDECRYACRLIVSYFVQDCEVFDDYSK